jgi:DNA processing protein
LSAKRRSLADGIMKKSPDSVLSWIGLSSVPGVGRTTFRKLVKRFGSPERALAAPPGELLDVEGVARKAVEAIASFSWREPAERELEKTSNAGITIITMDDAAFPESLRGTPDPPLFLYVKGALKPEDKNAVAIVGTRKPTYYGKTVTHRLAGELAASGFTVVSGLARGIDTQAHRGALAARGRTIAVLGCGIDVAYPPENRALMDEIGLTGAVVTENPFGTKPESGYFPARNRIISGLARGTVIIEAAEDSGSLITARYALEQGRKLFAVPGNIGSPVSRGTNSLIKEGAILIEGTGDVLAGLGAAPAAAVQRSPARPLPLLTPDESVVLKCIGSEPKHIDVLMSECRMAAGALGGVLVNLELKGLAKQLPGKYFVRDDC